MGRTLKTFAILACLPAFAMYQPPRASHGDSIAGGALAGAIASAHVAPQSSGGRPSPSTNSVEPVDAQKTLDENDRIIADNQRMIAVLQGYSRTDSRKLDRLTSQCQEAWYRSDQRGREKAVRVHSISMVR